MGQDSNIQQKLIALDQEIRDLKTARAIPSMVRFYRASYSFGAGTFTEARLLVTFAHDDNGTPPLLYYVMNGYPLVRPFDPDTDTQEIELQGTMTIQAATDIFYVVSNREIVSFTRTA